MSEQITTTRTLEVVAAEIRTFTASMLNNIIEIGRRLVEAKAMLPYGKFGEWVETQTGYSHSTANNFMRIFDEYGSRQGSLFGDLEDSQTFGKLSYSKALSLLALPPAERAEFVKAHDVEDMSTRELQAAIRERDEAIRERDASEKLRAELADELRGERADRTAAEKKIKELESRPVEVAVQVDEKAVAEAAKKARDEADTSWKKKTDALQKKLDAAEKKAEAAEKKTKAAEEAAQKADAAGAEEARAEAARIGAEAEALRAETARLKKELAMSGAAMTAFKLHFGAWQKAYADMCAALEQMDAETAGKMRGALAAQLRGWLEKST